MNVREKYRRFVCTLLIFGVLSLALCAAAVFPDAGSGAHAENSGDASAENDSGVEGTQAEEGASVSASATGDDASADGRKMVYVGGTPIGIYLETDGVYVVDTGEITAKDGSFCCPSENIVQSGDYIQAVDGKEVNTKEELIACISDCGGQPLVMEVERQGEQISLKITPVLDADGEYRVGIWVRNDTQGIGTLTWVDEEGYFGALGHGISDVDTAGLLDIETGMLYSAEVVSVVKGEAGAPGELSGIIHYNDSCRIGVIEENNENGIFGRVTGFSLAIEDAELIGTALKSEVEKGAATIRCSVDGTCREYEIEIQEVRTSSSDVNKGMVIEVTDPELLALTGGIVQGMSGSPILQNGRLVGAVTHVFVNDPAKGYGIFIEDML
ncbi:MAG: SpoIVB peptidase [Clostridiales bacterium]|nr:SpoIVB peptidase [Clostridiales bacterium]